MACKKWNESINQILIEKYANIKNEELAKEFGYSLRTIERHARMLGLRKSKEFMRQTQLEASRKGTLELEYRSIVGKLILVFLCRVFIIRIFLLKVFLCYHSRINYS